jgi:hypothetical protein
LAVTDRGLRETVNLLDKSQGHNGVASRDVDIRGSQGLAIPYARIPRDAAASEGIGGSRIADLQASLDPANLYPALNADGVKEVRTDELPVMDKVAVNWFLGKTRRVQGSGISLNSVPG